MFALVAGTMFVGPFESEEDATAHLNDNVNTYDGVSTTLIRLVDPDEHASVAEPVTDEEVVEDDLE